MDMNVPWLLAAANAATSCAQVVPTRRCAPVTTAYLALEARKKSTKAAHLGADPQSFERKPKGCTAHERTLIAENTDVRVWMCYQCSKFMKHVSVGMSDLKSLQSMVQT